MRGPGFESHLGQHFFFMSEITNFSYCAMFNAQSSFYRSIGFSDKNQEEIGVFDVSIIWIQCYCYCLCFEKEDTDAKNEEK